MSRIALDRIDLKILAVLERDARITNRALADTIGLSQSACLDRVRRLERAKVIASYHAAIDGTRLGDWVSVYAQIRLSSHAQGLQQAFEKRVAECAYMLDCVEVSGDYDYIVRFQCPNITAYQDLTAALLSDEALAVKEIKSHVVMRPVKGRQATPVAALQDTAEAKAGA